MTSSSLPGPRGAPFIGNAAQFIGRDPLAYWVDAWKAFGDTLFVSFGPQKAVLAAHPDDVRAVLVADPLSIYKGLGYDGLRLLLGNGLITSEGEDWRAQRRTMQPLFTPRASTRFLSLIAKTCFEHGARWRAAAGRGEVLDIGNEMMLLTMRIISRAMFGVDFSGRFERTGAAFDEAFDFITRYSAAPLKLPIFVPTPRNRRFRAARRLIDDFVGDLLADARHHQTGEPRMLDPVKRLAGTGPGGAQNPVDVRDQLVTLFFAGYETTARTLTWAIRLLAEHPGDLERVREEARWLDGVSDAGNVAIETVEAMTFTAAVIRETLRLYPPAALMARQNREEITLGGYAVAPETLLVVSPYITQRHPDFWHEPDRFVPARHLDQAPLHAHAFFPFGAGPRICIGQHFAMYEAVISLAVFLDSVDIEVDTTAQPDIAFHGTIKPARPILARVRPRR